LSETEAVVPVVELTSSEVDWNLAFQVLDGLLRSDNGCVSSMALRAEFEEKHGISDARPYLVALKYFDPESSRERGAPLPNFKFHHLGRSFYTDERYAQELKKQEDTTINEAEEASSREATEALPEEAVASRSYRQEEARLVQYVKKALEDLYSSDANSENSEAFVFDVHASRSGSSFENVDLIAVHWLPLDFCELVTVEVKLEFSAHAVHQALSYTRFSHRTWIAVPVDTDSHSSELRETNLSLFEYAISRGLGILACRRRRGKSYEVFPIHWPLRNQLDPLAEEQFKERYRDMLEEAGVLERRKKKFPRSR
jgi:hypothetical protein